MRFTLIFSLLFFLLASTAKANAQETDAPDYKQIKQATSNSRSANYYPTLMRKYLENDTTFTLEQYRNLYFGFVLQEDYIPYKSLRKQLTDARRRFTAARGNKDIAPEMIRIAKAALEDYPFDIRAISLIAVSYLQLGDTAQFKVWDIKQQGLLDAIISTGDGMEPESAFHVIDIEHEYEVLHRLGLVVVEDSLVNNKIEYLKVDENAEGERGFFFNFGACREAYKKKYE